VGHDLTKIGQAEFPPSEFDKELALVAAASGRGVSGSIFFTARPLVQDSFGARTAVVGPAWALPAVTPKLWAASEDARPAPPRVEWVRDDRAKGALAPRISWEPTARLRSLLVYESTAEGWGLTRVVPAAATPVGLRWVETHPKRRVAVALTDRFGRASEALVLTPPNE
jgi:hypothetical protein